MVRGAVVGVFGGATAGIVRGAAVGVVRAAAAGVARGAAVGVVRAAASTANVSCSHSDYYPLITFCVLPTFVKPIV